MKVISFIFPFIFLTSILSAQFLSPVPTGEILPHKTAALYVDGKIPLDESVTSKDIDLALGGGLFDKLYFSIVMYSNKAYALNLEYVAIPGTNALPKLAFGLDNITQERYISSFGSGKDTRWENKVYRHRNSEQFSLYGVIQTHIGISDVTAGLGRGKFVGYGTWTRNLNTDFYSDKKHNDAFGLFFNLQFFNIKGFKPYFSVDGRNYDYGFTYDQNFFALKAGFITPNSLLSDDLRNSLIDIGIGIYSKAIFKNKNITENGYLKGRVYDEKTVQPLQAMITITGGKYYNTVETNSNGSYSIELKEGIYNIHVSCERYYWKEKTVNIAAGGVLYCNFKLKKKPPSPSEE